jgi:hypothetical protein
LEAAVAGVRLDQVDRALQMKRAAESRPPDTLAWIGRCGLDVLSASVHWRLLKKSIIKWFTSLGRARWNPMADAGQYDFFPKRGNVYFHGVKLVLPELDYLVGIAREKERGLKQPRTFEEWHHGLPKKT